MQKTNSNKSSRRGSMKTGASKIVRKEILDNKVESSSAEFTPEEKSSQTFLNKKNKILLTVLVIAVLLAVLGYFFKDKIIVAIVNGKPIFRYELSQRLTSTFGKETLENIIVEKLIKEEAKRKGIVIGDSDIEKEVEKIGKSLGNGMKIEDVLKMQGVSLADFKNQLKLRLQVNKILEKETTVSDEEIDKYIKDNLKVMVATGEAERKIEAKGKLVEQKISEKIQLWIKDLLEKAKIVRFLN